MYAKDTQDWINEDPTREGLINGLDQLGEFGASLLTSFDKYGSLTERQEQAARESLERKSAEPEGKPVVEGRGELTGEVLVTKIVDGYYGSVRKMLLQEDRGFRVWGTVPAALAPKDVPGGLRGARITLTATVEVSQDDETFGFFKRPSKAAITH